MRKILVERQRLKSKIGWNRFLTKVKKRRDQKRHELYKDRNIWRNRWLPKLSESIRWIEKCDFAFDKFASLPKEYLPIIKLRVPKVFSIVEKERESLEFLRKLFDILRHQKCTTLLIDYEDCQEIELGASVCMDIILNDFIKHYKQCENQHLSIKLQSIIPLNYKKRESIGKFLFSIGAFSNIKGVQLQYNDIITYPLCIGCKSKPNSDEIMEVHTTQLVDYLKACLLRMKRELTAAEERFFFQVIGEVMANAEEHSTTKHRYSIGYFQVSENPNEHIGVFNLVILNFGATIYEKFHDPECPASNVVHQMEELSRQYTKKGFLREADFKEETLWTLYALQEGVTSTGQQRGSGTIRFAEGFFNLKGDKSVDDISRLTILSGNTRIVFDGTYGIVEEEKGVPKTKFKMLTFNESGKIQDKPDNKYVSFVQNYFPGTLIIAKICIKS